MSNPGPASSSSITSTDALYTSVPQTPASSYATYATDASGNVCKIPYILAQTAIPVIMPPSSQVNADGSFYLGSAVGGGTLTFGAVSGSTTVTLSAAGLLGTTYDVGKVFWINDGGTFKNATITTFGTTTTATVSIPVALSSVGAWAATAWQVSQPFPMIYADAWIYLPATALVSGIAGLYYVHMTSTTTGLIYQAYALPSTTTAFWPYDADASVVLAPVVGTGLQFTQTTATAIQLINLPLPANSLGNNGALRVSEAAFTSTTTTNKVVNCALGAASNTNLISYTVLNQPNSFVSIIGRMQNRNAPNVQYCFTNSSGVGSSAYNSTFQGAVDTTIQQPIHFSVNLQTAPTDFVVIESIIIEVLPN